MGRGARPRLALRAFVSSAAAASFLPVILLPTVLLESGQDAPYLVWGPIITLALLLVGLVWAIVTPERGVQDRIAGTHLVPR